MNNNKKAFFESGSWSSIVGVFLFGVLGAASVSKIIPLGDQIKASFEVSPAEFGLLISLIGFVAAIAALPSGILVDRFGPRAVLIGSAIVGLLANVGYFFGPNLLSFQIMRIFEGMAIVMFYTAGPAFLMATNEGKRLGSAMTVWSTYMPIGTTVGLFIGGYFAEMENWRIAFLLQSLLFCIVALLTLMQPGVYTVSQDEISTFMDRVKGVGRAYSKLGILLLSITFLIMISLGFGANSTLPSYIAQVHLMNLSDASKMVASVTLVMVFGSLLNGILMSRGWRPYYLFISFALAGIIFGSMSFYPDISVTVRLFMIAGWLFLSGAATAGLMSMMPLVAEPQERASAAALVNQAGAIATFITPPIWLSIAAGNNWLPFAYMMIAGLLVASLLCWIISTRVNS